MVRPFYEILGVRGNTRLFVAVVIDNYEKY